MKKLMIVTALMTALMGTSAAFAEDSKEKDSKSISFEEAEKMEQMSEQDKKQKGAGLKTYYDLAKKGGDLIVKGLDYYGRYQAAKDIYKGVTSPPSSSQSNYKVYDFSNDMNANAGKTMPPPTNYYRR